MAKINPCFLDLKNEYLFPIIERKLFQLKEKVRDAQIINLGIGDVALPLSPFVAGAIINATLEMATQEGMKGYGPAEGYDFLKKKIVEAEYSSFGISSEEIFISDGINTDCVNLLDLCTQDSIIGIPSLTYPAYLQASLLSGKKVLMLPCHEENGFTPIPPEEHCDFIYLCSPGNPTGIAFTFQELQRWISYAKEHRSIIIYDNAYKAFIESSNIPSSIFAIDGAHEVAIELCSFSKSAGFTGLRCAYAVISKKLQGECDGNPLPIHTFWKKRQNIKFNGLAYPIQKGAEAVFSPQGQQETREQVNLYKKAAKILKEGLTKSGYTTFGGIDAPYIWWKVQNMPSWDFFDLLLEKCHLVTIPGRGFGESGEGFIRLSTFTTEEIAKKAIERINYAFCCST